MSLIIPMSKASGTGNIGASEDPGVITEDQVSKNLKLQEANQEDSNVRERLLREGVPRCDRLYVQKGGRPIARREISSRKHDYDCEWGISNVAAKRHSERYEHGRLETCLQASRNYEKNQKKSDSKESGCYGCHEQSVADRERKSLYNLEVSLQSHGSSSEWEDKLDRSDGHSSPNVASQMSPMKISSPTFWSNNYTSGNSLHKPFVNPNPQLFEDYFRVEQHLSKKPSDMVKLNKAEVLPTICDNMRTRTEQQEKLTHQAELSERVTGRSIGQPWRSGRKRVANRSASRTLPMKQWWTTKRRLRRNRTSVGGTWNTGSRKSLEVNTNIKNKRDCGGKNSRSKRNFGSWGNADRRMTGRKKIRKEYVLASQSTCCQRKRIFGSYLQSSGSHLQFEKNLRSKSSSVNKAKCVGTSSKSATVSMLHLLKERECWDPVAARLRQRSVKLSNMNDSDSGTGSSDYDGNDREDSTSQQSSIEHTISIKIPQNSCTEPISCTFATFTNDSSPDACCIQLNKLIKIDTNKHLGEVAMYEKENLHAAELKKVTQYVISKKLSHKKDIPLTPHFRQTSVYHPCYIADNLGQIMSFLSLVEIMKTKRVSKTWEIAANSTLRRRTGDNLTLNPPSTAEAGSMMLSQVHILLPRLECLTISIKHFKHLKGLVLSYICDCENLVFLRVESLDWRDLTIATRVILSLRDPGSHGHPILNVLQELELPDLQLPIPTSTHCMRLLSKLAPNLRSLTVKSAQDPIIFSLRLFFPTVRNLFLLDTLWTTRRFAQIISSSPHLMKFLMYGQKVRMLTPMVTESSGMHISTPRSSSRSERTSARNTPRKQSSSSVPGIPIDYHLTPFISNHQKSLHIEPLGRLRQIETGKDLTTANIGMFARFCALIGVLIVMPPIDGHE